MQLSAYLKLVKKTDKLPQGNITPVLFGLYGEVGELLTVAKKKEREPKELVNKIFKDLLIEEFGDIFWYLSCLALRAKRINLEEIIESLSLPQYSRNALLKKLGKVVGDCLEKKSLHEEEIRIITKYLFSLMDAYEINFTKVLESNGKKISSRFIKSSYSQLPKFDEYLVEYERLPNRFKIEFVTKDKKDKIISIRWNGVFIGDPLTDNSADADGYRFHDVFHFSYGAMLHWSPVFRSLIQHKRKSQPNTDENQDGGRAKVVEEGLSAWIFNVAKENDFFEGRETLTFDTLKHIGQAVKGLEVEQCPLWLWEKTILKGYEVFRNVQKNHGGIVIGDRNKRTILYKNSGG